MGNTIQNRVDGPLSAAILAGGKSSRMGMDKALLSLGPESPPFIVRTREHARSVAAEVFVVATDRPAYEQFGMQVIPDAFTEGGTLGAIATALRHARYEHCLVLACDLPFLSVDLLRWMIQYPRGYDVLVPRTSGSSRQGDNVIYHTLHAIYSKGCLPAIEAQLQSGQRQIVRFFDKVSVQPIAESDLRRFDPELRSLFNANTPEALEMAREWAAELEA